MTVLHLSYLHCISVAAYGVYVLYVLVISTQSPEFGVIKSDMVYLYKVFKILLHSNFFQENKRGLGPFLSYQADREFW